MQKLMIDMDNVITDGNVLELICEFLNQDIDFKNVKIDYLQELLGNREDEFWEWAKDRNIYHNAVLKENCLEVLKILNKYNFLRVNLPFLKPQQLILTNEERLLDFDIRIDDQFLNLEGAKTKILKDKKILRVQNWLQIKEILDRQNETVK